MNKFDLSRGYKIGLVILWPMFVAAIVSFVYYPGFMSYDSIHAMESSRNGITDSIWPPMVSYVWWLVDRVSNNPSLMQFTQLSVLFTSISLLIYSFTKKFSASFLFFFIYLSVPVILGTVSVIWKDVLTAAFLLAGFAAVVLARNVKNKYVFYSVILLSLLLLFIGISTRHNSITAALPIIFIEAFLVVKRWTNLKFRQVVYSTVGAILITASLFSLKVQLDHYALPSFNKLSGTDDFFPPIQKLDLAGASICAGENLFGNAAPGLSVEDISKIYDPRHVNLSVKLLETAQSGQSLTDAWVNTLTTKPYCFTHQKRQLAKYLLGLNPGEQFLITDPGISENEYGITLQPSSLRDELVQATITNSTLFLFRPWFIFLLATLAMALVISIRQFRKAFSDRILLLAGLYVAGVGYLAGLILFGNAADARLPFFSNTAFLIVAFIIFWEMAWGLVDDKFNPKLLQGRE